MPEVVAIRPTQQARRAETRAALLDATVESLVEVGYAATSTRGVAERAGVSQGALQHHFPSKAQLVDAAINHIVNKIADQVHRNIAMQGNERERAEIVIDWLWTAHNLPIAGAVFELFQVARTDPDIAQKITATLEQGIEMVHAIIASIIPSLAALPGFTTWLQLAENQMRGAVILSSIPGARDGFAPWETVRTEILRGLDALIADTNTTRLDA